MRPPLFVRPSDKKDKREEKEKWCKKSNGELEIEWRKGIGIRIRFSDDLIDRFRDIGSLLDAPAGCQSINDRIPAIREVCHRTYLFSGFDRRLKITVILDKNQVLRLRSAPENHGHTG